MTFSNSKKGRFARLLPSVVALGAVVLALKTTDLVQDAYAQVSGQVAALTGDPASTRKDFAGGEDDQIASASQVDVINSLSKRRRELDARDAQLNTQANMIAAAEQRVDAKISQLKQLQAQITALLVQRDDAQKAQIASLVKTYSTMKAKDAARIFNNLPDDVLIPVAHDMKSDIMAQVLANMNADNAKTLTVKLAGKLTLPQTADAIAPVPVAAPVAPVQAAAAPAPMQVASVPTTAPATAAQPPATAPAAPAAKPRRRRPAAAPTADQTAATTPAKAPEATATAAASTPPAATPTTTPAASTPPAATPTPAAATTSESTAKPKG